MRGWLLVGVVVAGFDEWALRHGRPTMSAWHRDAFAAHPVMVSAAWAYLVAGHLTGWLPARFDVLVQVAVRRSAWRTRGDDRRAGW